MSSFAHSSSCSIQCHHLSPQDAVTPSSTWVNIDQLLNNIFSSSASVHRSSKAAVSSDHQCCPFKSAQNDDDHLTNQTRFATLFYLAIRPPRNRPPRHCLFPFFNDKDREENNLLFKWRLHCVFRVSQWGNCVL